MGKNIEKLHEHPTKILEMIWKIVIVAIFFLFGQVDTLMEIIKTGKITIEDKTSMIVLMVAFAVVVVLIIISIGRWRKTTLEISNNHLILHRKTVFENKKEIAIPTISNVNLEQNLFERIVGTYKIKIDTSTISTSEKNDIVFLLKEDDAFRVKNTINAILYEEEVQTDVAINSEQDGVGKQDKNSTVNGTSWRKEDYDFSISDFENLKCSFAEFSAIGIGAFLFLIFIAVAGLYLLGATHGDASSYIAFVVLLLSVFASVFKSSIGIWLRNYDFRVKRIRDMIYITSGALKVRNYSVPVSKIQALQISSTVFGRLMNRSSVTVLNVGGEDEDVNGQWLLPAVKNTEIKGILETILPEYQIRDDVFIKRPKRVVLLDILKGPIMTSLTFILAYFVFVYINEHVIHMKNECFGVPVFFFVIIAVYFAVAFSESVLKVAFKQKTKGIRIESDYIVVSDGDIDRKILYVPYEKIQCIHVLKGPLLRLFKLEKGRIDILASTASRNIVIPEFDYDILDETELKFRKTF